MGPLQPLSEAQAEGEAGPQLTEEESGGMFSHLSPLYRGNRAGTGRQKPEEGSANARDGSRPSPSPLAQPQCGTRPGEGALESVRGSFQAGLKTQEDLHTTGGLSEAQKLLTNFQNSALLKQNLLRTYYAQGKPVL